MKHFNITIAGKVHGVFFRASAKDEATRLGVYGFACNLPDGSVYLEAEGTEPMLTAFIKWCHRGSSQAFVTDVKVVEGEIRNFSEFRIVWVNS